MHAVEPVTQAERAGARVSRSGGRGATIRDVARSSRTSTGTVSRVLNDSPRVRPATRLRVLQAIDELDYVPSPTARRLSIGKTHTIGIVVPFFSSPSVIERLRGIERTLSRTHYDLIVINVETPERRVEVLRDLPRPDRIDGLLVISISPHPDEAARLERAGMPVVLVDAHHRRLPRVVVDDVLGGRLAGQHVLGIGHRRIGFIGDDADPRFGFFSSERRLRGLRGALRLAGVDLEARMIRRSPHSRDAAAEDAVALLRDRRPPSAMVCASDTQALGALEAAQALGVAVPHEVSIMGYDDIEVARWAGLTTIRQPLDATGVAGATALLDALAGRAIPRRRTFPLELVARATTGAPFATTRATTA